MILNEDFLRCPICENAYFRKNTFVLIKKNSFEGEKNKIVEYKNINEYVCSKCGNMIGERKEDF